MYKIVLLLVLHLYFLSMNAEEADQIPEKTVSTAASIHTQNLFGTLTQDIGCLEVSELHYLRHQKMVSNLPIQLLLVQLSNMYINPENYKINLTAPSNDSKIGVIHLSKDDLLDARRIQELETENHILSTELNMTEILLHKTEENNQRLRHEQIRNRVRKALLRNATSQYIKTKNELDAKIERLAQVETMLNNTENTLVQVKEESETWRRKCERYENKILKVVEDGLGKKAAKLKSKQAEVEILKEKCTEGNCQLENSKRDCTGEKNWCCWLDSIHDNAVETTTTENDEEKCKELSLVEASKINNVTIMSDLLESKTKVQTSLPKSPLHWATENGHYEACSLLVKQGANVNARDPGNFNTTPIHVAAELGFIPILELFLSQATADINARDMDGWTPLHWAVTFNHTTAVHLLLQYEADVDITDNEGQTPLHHAALNGNLQIVQALLDNYANVNAVDKEGHTPLHFATLSNHFNTTSNVSNTVLYPVGNDPATRNNSCKILHRFMTSHNIRDKAIHFTNLNYHTQTFDTSVPAKVLTSCIAKHDCKEIALLLLRNGAELAKDKKGVTPFQGASEECKNILEAEISLQKKLSETLESFA